MWSKRCRRTCNRSMMIDMWATCVALHATRACGQKCERTWRHLACDPGHATSHVEHEGRFCSSEDQISSVQTSPRGYSLKIGPVQSSRQYWVSAKSSSINKLFIGIEHCETENLVMVLLLASHCFLKLKPLSQSWSRKWWARFSLVDHQGQVSHVDMTTPGESGRGPGHGDSY
ncbi:hypothetical protein DY000_02006913 [Brassica cretica]|uniref:Uncharacterized protein n=1 Tax=Brassica cretica TaxID=69181 RepID=A0ABQ7CLR1_BRACR|nr:hypothetical protein DY000_02006913 [Brassica cretica]